MPKILAYMTLPDNKIDQLKSLIKKTHGNPTWMEEHAKRTGINSIDTFFAKLPTGTAMIVVRDPRSRNWWKVIIRWYYKSWGDYENIWNYKKWYEKSDQN